MKKRIVSLILAVLVVAGLMATAVFATEAQTVPTSTSNGVCTAAPDGKHQLRTYQHIDYKKDAEVCTGHTEYYYSCSNCGAKLTDKTFKSTADSDFHETVARTYPNVKYLVTDKTCTSYAVYYQSCKICGGKIEGKTFEYVQGGYAEHTPTEKVDAKYLKSAATCTEPAVYYKSCAVCGEKLGETFVSGTVADHKLVKTEAMAATCEKAGNNAYWTCSVCKKVFSDAQGKNETTVEKQTIPALDHDYTGATITYTWTGVTACKAERTCTREGCGHVDTVNATITSAVTTAATCEKSGVRTYTATFTGAPFVNQTKTETIAATGHNWKQTWVWSDADRYNNRTASLSLDCQNTGCTKSVKLAAKVTYKVTREPTATRKGTCEWTATAAYNNVTYTDTQVGELDKNGKLDYSYYYVLYFETNGGSAIQTYFSDYYNVVDLTKYNPTRRGYTFDGWYSDVTLRTRVTSVTLRANKPVTVYAGWTKGETAHNANTCSACAFRDVSVNDWFHDYVRFVVDNQMMQGTYTSWFEPKEDMTREQLVRAMYRVAGEPYVRVNGVFKDVKSTDSFAKAVEWAANYGIVNGVGNGKFDPYSPVTREQMAAIFYRFANYVEKYGYTTYRTVGFDWNYSTKLTFKDADKVSSWAKDAVAWCVKNGILYGDARNNVNPQYSTTRAEGAAILTRFCK